uniref:Uncharacterized protein n=1 Tax=Nelumbo nucifera TaxID=4432 RepID=A0A822YE12_NELNU|nr:TPA_asm: hypothetical protein HUJ06_009473 [Nelumbo nucifera]
MASSSAVDLADIPSVDLMTELLRRMKCSTKPDKRLILIGNSLFIFLFLSFHVLFSSEFRLGFFFLINFASLRRCVQI